jgi:hypothetical protein
VAWLAASWLRFNFEIPPSYTELAVESRWWRTFPINALILSASGCNRGIWRLRVCPISGASLLRVFVAALAVPAVMLMLQITPPRSVFVIAPVFLIMAMGGSRLLSCMERA